MDDLHIQETMKTPQEVVDQVKTCLVAGFFSKTTLKDVAEHLTDTLDQTAGGLWLCHIRPQEVENGLIRSEYRGLTLTFKRFDEEYEVQVA